MSAPRRLAGQRVLVTGATGYVGGRLIPRLLDEGADVRALARSAPRKASWVADVELVRGDASKRGDLRRALREVDVAYYLLHSMDGHGDLVERERAMASAFADEAAHAGVRRIVYLGGLHPDGELSTHLRSRATVADTLLAGDVPTAALQASVVLGAGSASFDMLRYLTYRLPVMPAPKWSQNRLQPIAIDDALHFLIAAASLPPEVNRNFHIGGPEVLTYGELIGRFADAAGIRRPLLPRVPTMSSSLAGHAISLVAPVSPGLAAPLIESLAHDTVAQENDLERLIPPPGGLTGLDDALRRAERDSPRDVRALDFALWATASATATTLTTVGRFLGRFASHPAPPEGDEA